MADILSSLLRISSDFMNFGANVLEVLACRWRELFRMWDGTELSEVVGEYDCWRSCLDPPVGVGVGDAKRSDLLV
jgi:hypothetical protein